MFARRWLPVPKCASNCRVSPARFSVYKQFNDPALQRFASMKHRLHSLPQELFPTENLPDRLARALARHRAVHIKELLEAFEFFAKVRRRVRRPTMVDLCAGHGLAGLIFALCEESVTAVRLMDDRIPESFPRILSAFREIAPWVAEKVSYERKPLSDASALPSDAGVLLVHACGDLTDRGLSLAARAKGPVAAMPCCYGKAVPARVPGLSQTLGYQTTVDISRSYMLTDAGYRVDWSTIPTAITPMNRVIVGWDG